MGRLCAPDGGAGERGQTFVSILLGLAAVGSSFAVSPDVRGAFGAALGVLMIAIAVSDARRFIIPNRLNAAAFVLAVLSAALFDRAPLVPAIAACLLRALAVALPLLALMAVYERVRGRAGLGLGDVKLAAVAGAWLDWFTIVAVIEAAALAALAGYAVRRYALRRPITAATALPFGLFFAPAIWLGWLAEAVLRAQ